MVNNHIFFAGKLSLGGDLGQQQVGKSAAELAAMCNAETSCKGFTSSGWLKRSIKQPALWVAWPTMNGSTGLSPCDGMFVKSGADYEGKLHIMPVSTLHRRTFATSGARPSYAKTDFNAVLLLALLNDSIDSARL